MNGRIFKNYLKNIIYVYIKGMSDNQQIIKSANKIESNNIIELEQIKYNLVLELVNKFLLNMNKPLITQLEQFKDIVRQDVITEANYKAVEEMESSILKHFDKAKSGYYQKKRSVDNYPVNFIRGLLRQINYKLEHKEEDKTIKMNNQSYRQKIIFYSIEK